MPSEFYITNKAEVNKSFSRLLANYPKLTKDAMIAYSMDVVNYVKGKIKGDSHIITGRLRRSIHWMASNKQMAGSKQISWSSGSKEVNGKTVSWKGGTASRELAAVPKENEIFVGTNVNYADYVVRNMPEGYTTHALSQGIKNVDIQKSINAYLAQHGKRAL